MKDITGLPEEIGGLNIIAKEQQRIEVTTTKRRYGKITTLVKGIDPKAVDLHDLVKKLKSKLACGGTVKGDVIELQGDHRTNIKRALVELGFPENTITIL